MSEKRDIDDILKDVLRVNKKLVYIKVKYGNHSRQAEKFRKIRHALGLELAGNIKRAKEVLQS